MSATAAGSELHAVRVAKGAAHWLRCYRRMLRYDFASQRQWLPFLFIVQLLLSAGMAVLYGFYFATVPPRIAAFIVTGTPALAIIPLGFLSVPSVIADQKTAGTYDFVRSLPVPRMAAIASIATVYTALALPALVVAPVLASWRYGIHLSVSPLIVPAVLLTALMSTCVGAAIGHAVANPMVTNLIGNLLVFFVLLFSPIVFPASQFPHWLVEIHDWLPFYNMATVLRDGLSNGLATGVGRAYFVLAVWTLGGLGLAWHAVTRRG